MSVGELADDAQHFGWSPSAAPAPRAIRVAFLSSWNSRTFSMAITAWSAKVLSSAICLSVNGRTSSPANHESPRSQCLRAATARRASCECRALPGSAADVGILTFALPRGHECGSSRRSSIARPADRATVEWVARCRLVHAHGSVVRAPVEACRLRQAESQHRLRHTTARRSLRLHPTPAEYQSASWR